MEITKAAVAIVAAACVAAGAAGGYLVTRSAEGPDPVSEPTAAPSLSPDPGPAVGVEQSEALVANAPSPAVVPAEPPSPLQAPSRPRPAPISTPAPSRPAPAPSDSRDAATEVTPIAPAVLEPVRPVELEQARTIEPAEPELQDLVVSGDSVIGLQVETAVSSETARVEDEVVARVTRDVKVGDHVAIPAGSKARGEVTLVERGGKVRERARLGVRFTSIVLGDGTRVPISTETIYREGDAPGRESATKISGGAIGGAILGGILGGAKGAAIGGSIGAGAGSAAVLAGGRNAATLAPGSPVTIRLQEPATVTIEK